MSSGIIAAQDGRTIEDTPLAYSSEYGHLKVDSRPELERLKIYEGTCGDSALSARRLNGGPIDTKQQVFYRLEHKLDYIPRVSVYMLIRDAPPVIAGFIGSFAGGFITNAGFPFEETIFFRVDEKYVYLIHRASALMFSDNPYTSLMQTTRIRARIIINSNEVAGEPYESIDDI